MTITSSPGWAESGSWSFAVSPTKASRSSSSTRTRKPSSWPIENDWPILDGDATDQDTLIAAGIERARSLVSTLDTDADNLFVTFTSRALNPELFIVARSTHESNEERLRQAGANRVITPNEVSGRRMATMVLHPVVSDYPRSRHSRR